MTDFPLPDIDLDPDDVVTREVIEHSKAATENSLARRLALQALYELDTTTHPMGMVISHLLSSGSETLSIQVVASTEDDADDFSFTTMIEMRKIAGKEEERVVEYFQRLVRNIMRARVIMDEVLQSYAPEFPIHQVAVIDRNILRIALYEMVAESIIPISVAIDEAIELSKLFGSDGTSRFINGVLGAIALNIDAVTTTIVIAVADTAADYQGD